MKKRTNKGFTLTELIIVIVIIGILAAVLIPTLTACVKKAKISNDKQLVRNLNLALSSDTKVLERGGKHLHMQEALEAAAAAGYDVEKINATKADNEILWDAKNDVFCYLNGDDIEYIPSSVADTDQLDATDDADCILLWKIKKVVNTGENAYADLTSEQFSIYASDESTATVVKTDKGFDAGTYKGIESVEFTRTTAAGNDVVIRTNGGTLTVNAEYDTVNHYGDGLVLNIENIDTQNCYREFGKFASAQIKRGKVVIENGESKIDNLLLIAKSFEEGFDDIIVESKAGATLPTLDRTDVEIASTGTLVVNIVTPSTDEYIYLTKAGVVEQIVVKEASEIPAQTKPKDVSVNSTEANVEDKSTTTQTAAEQIANIGKKNEAGTAYVDADGNDISLENLTSENIVVEEAKADDTAIQTGLTKFAGGAGTEKSPYLISNPEEFLNISSGSNIATKYYLLISNINFDEETYSSRVLDADPFNSWCLISNTDESQIKNINLDGGYHSLSLSIIDCGVAGANRLCLFGYLGGASTLENIDVIIDNYDSGENCFFTLVDYSGWNEDDHLTFKNITAKSNIQNATISGLLYNNGIFTSQTYYGKVDFINCDNYVNLNGTNNKYYAPYIGGYIQSYSQVSFTDCDNYGNLSGVGSAAMFIGNNTNINKNSVTITNSYNYGTIRAASASGLFAQNSNSANAREIEELYLASCNRGIISVQSFNGFTYSIKENEINYNLTNTNNVGKIVLRINGHTSVLDNNNEYIGARGFQITQEISLVNSTNGTFIYKLGQVIRQLDYNLDIELSNSNKIYDDGEYVKVYYVEKDNQAYYVFDDGYGNYSVSPNLSIAITAYSTSGSILGNAVLEND